MGMEKRIVRRVGINLLYVQNNKGVVYNVMKNIY